MARLRSSARGESLSALALIRNASRPPLWSTLLMALVETRRRTLRPSTSEMKVTLHRFGRNRRLVLMLEWLTLLPTSGPLAVNSQRRDIFRKSSAIPGLFQPTLGGQIGVQNYVHLGSGGRIGADARGVKVLRAKTSFSGPRAGFPPSYKRRIPRRNDPPYQLRREKRILPKNAPISIYAYSVRKTGVHFCGIR